VEKKEGFFLTEEDLRAAIREMKTYVDITEGDLKKIYETALRIAKERSLTTVPVERVMTKEVYRVKVDTTVREVAQMLMEYRISGLPVVDEEDRVIGVVSEADLLPLTGMRGSALGRFKKWWRERITSPKIYERVGEVMNKPAITISPSDHIGKAAALLNKWGIKRLPVVNDEGKLIGIVSRADIVRVIGEVNW